MYKRKEHICQGLEQQFTVAIIMLKWLLTIFMAVLSPDQIHHVPCGLIPKLNRIEKSGLGKKNCRFMVTLQLHDYFLLNGAML